MTMPSPHAGAVSRAAAFAIDALLTTIGTLLFALGVALIKAVFIGRFSADGSLAPAAVLAAAPVIFGLYSVTGWTLTGRTVGKAALGLRVVDRAGRRPSAGRSIVRALGYLVSSILWIGFAWIIVDRRHDGFHDKIARTHVVYDQG
jgi:uncharacterized RDD family membrane protein YckC